MLAHRNRSAVLTVFLCLLLIPSLVFGKDPLIPSEDMVYSGAFKLPDASTGYSWFVNDVGGYNSSSAAWNDNNSTIIFIAEEDPGEDRFFAEIGLGTLRVGAGNTLPSYGDLTGAYVGSLNPNSWSSAFVEGYPAINGSDYCRLGDILIHGAEGSQATGKIYSTAISGYGNWSDCSGDISDSLSWSEIDFDNYSLTGQWGLSGIPNNYLGNYILAAPDWWMTENSTAMGDKKILTGYYRAGGAPINGPSLYASAPWEHCQGDPIECDTDPPPAATDFNVVTLMQYDALAPYRPYNPNDTIDDLTVQNRYNDTVWVTVGDKSALVMLAWIAERTLASNTHSYGTHPAYSSEQGSSYWSGSGRAALVFFDPDDLASVASGTLAADKIQPYAYLDLAPYWFSGLNCAPSTLNGLAYDETNQKLYIIEYNDGNYQAVHAWTLSDTGTTLDATAPAAPVVSVSATNDTATLSWDAVSTAAFYSVYANGILIYTTDSTSFAHTYTEYFTSPVEYYITATDSVGNVSAQSTSKFIDEDNGGNKPLMIFVPGIGNGTMSHETTSCPDALVGSDYSCVPTIKGGSSVTWSWSGGTPTGMSLNTSTGEIYDTDDSANSISKARFSLTATDSDSSIYRIFIDLENGTSDYDGDGWTSGAGDADDFTINTHPGSPSQAKPTNLAVERSGNDDRLTWDLAVPMDNIFYVYSGYNYDHLFWGEISYEIHQGVSSGTYDDDVFIGRGKRTTSGQGYKELSRIDELVQGTNYIGLSAYAFRGLQSVTPHNEIQVEMLGGNIYGGYHNEGEDEKVAIVETNDGGAAIASFSSSYSWLSGVGNERARLLIVKADAYGVEDWRKLYSTSGVELSTASKHVVADVHGKATGIIETGTDDLIVAGYQGTASEGLNVVLMKTDDEGTPTWFRDLNRTGSVDDAAHAVIEVSGGGFAIIGQSYVSDTDGLLLLTDANGQNPDWNTYNTNGKGFESLRQVRQSSDGGFIGVGYTSTGAAQDEDYYVVKTTSDGTLSWAQRYDNSSRRDKAYGVEEDASGNFWVVGRSQQSGQENTNVWIVKLNSSGVEQDDYSIGDAVAANAYVGKNSQLLSNGNLLVVGYTNVTGNDGYDGYLAEIDISDGSVDWSATFSVDQENKEDYLQECVIDSAGTSFLCAGVNNSGVSNAYDLWHLQVAASDRAVENLTECTTKGTYYMDPDMDGTGTEETASLCFAMDGYASSGASVVPYNGVVFSGVVFGQ